MIQSRVLHLFLLLACVFFVGTSNAATLTVGSGGTYATLNDAYTAANSGDVIEIVESGLTEKIFIEPEDKRTEDYITGRFG